MSDFNYGQPYVIAVGLAEQDGKFLMVKEASGPAAGLWNLPAGHWDSEERLTDAVKREFREETGYEFEPKAIVGVYTVIKTYAGSTVTLLRMVFVGSISGDPILSTDEISEMKWFTPEEIYNMDENTIRTQDNKTIVRDYLSGKKYPLDLISHSSRELREV